MNKLMVRMNKKNKKGFTLVELIVVMAILAILAAILIPSVSGMIRRSNQAVDNATARNLYMAGTMALAENEALTGDLLSPTRNASVTAFMGSGAITSKTKGNWGLNIVGGEVRVTLSTTTGAWDPTTGSFPGWS